MIRFATVLQSHWDWRAAGNFVLGGAGSSLLAWSALAALGGAVLLWPVLLALALVGAGLGCTLAALVLLRALVWRRYRDGLAATGAPAATQARLARIDPLPVGGGWVAAGLAVGAAFASTPAAAALLPLAGLAAVAGGWAMKFTIVTRAAHLQGYAFGRLRHGHPLGNGRAASQLPQRRSR